jgi:hypothetical protein
VPYEYFKNPPNHDIQHQTTTTTTTTTRTTTTTGLLITALVLIPSQHVKHHHLNTDAFYVVSQFCEMEGKVFPYAE